MIRSAVTISLVAEARGGPFVFWDDLDASCKKAAEFGFDAVELFVSGPNAVDTDHLRSLLEHNDLSLAAVGTGAGMVKHGLSLTSTDASRREKAIRFVQDMIDFGGPFGAPAIIGSMQGKWSNDLRKKSALDLLRAALNPLGEHASQYNCPLIYEPLNRYETNLICTVADGVDFLQTLSTVNVKLLADLFHMNIEESNLPDAIQTGASSIGHVHFVDSNRRPAGNGHLDFMSIAIALQKIDYDRYASVEAFPFPDPDLAAKQAITAYNKYFKALS